MPKNLERVCREHLAIAPWHALALIVLLAVAGAAVAILFPKWKAEGLLETPGVVVVAPDPQRERTNDNGQAPLPKTQYVTLAEYRKVAAAYSSVPSLSEFFAAAGKSGPAVDRLLAQAENPGFWNGVASPVLPFSRRDAREFGELKDAASNSLVGVDLATDARTPELAVEMLATMSDYYVNGFIRERIRGWILKHGGEAPARQKALLAEVVEAQTKIETMGLRIKDLRTILARYPEAAKLDARQVVNITEGSDRFLSPLVQLVAAETSITQLRETIARKERQARQYDFQQRYFAQAEKAVQSTLLVRDLVPALTQLASQRFEKVDSESDWAREVVLRIQADVAGFASALASFGIRNDARVAKVSARDPVRLAAFAAGAGLLLLGLVAFVRASLRAPSADAADA
jgi:hypothetical protein